MGAPEPDEACSEDQELLTATSWSRPCTRLDTGARKAPRLLLPTLGRSKCSGESIQASVKKTCRHPAARGHHSDRFAYILDRIQRVVIEQQKIGTFSHLHCAERVRPRHKFLDEFARDTSAGGQRLIGRQAGLNHVSEIVMNRVPCEHSWDIGRIRSQRQRNARVAECLRTAEEIQDCQRGYRNAPRNRRVPRRASGTASGISPRAARETSLLVAACPIAARWPHKPRG